MPNGFGDIITKWQQRFTEASQLIEVQRPKLAETPKELSFWQRALYKIPQMTSYPFFESTQPWSMIAKKALTSKGVPEAAAGMATTPFTAVQERIKPPDYAAYEQEAIIMSQAVDEAKLSEWFLTTYANATPEGLVELSVNSGEEYIQLHGPATHGLSNMDIDPEELAELEDYIDYVLGRKPAPTEGEAGVIEAWLTKPMPTRPAFKGIHTTTVDEMVKYLRRETASPELPHGVSEADVRNNLLESGFSPEEEAAARRNAEPFAQQIRAWEESMIEIQEYKSGARSPGLPEETFGVKAKRLFFQPGLVMMDVIQPYLSHVIYPWSATNLRHWSYYVNGLSLMFTPSTYEVPREERAALLEEKMKEENAIAYQLDELTKANREAGMDWWSARGKAWEDLKIAGWQKLAIEVAVDPLNFIGWGWFIKASHAVHALRGARGIPVVNQLFTGAAAFERGFLLAGEGVYWLGKNTFGRIKPTAQQLSWLITRHIKQAIPSQLDAILTSPSFIAKHKGWATSYTKLTDDQFTQVIEEAIKFRRHNPLTGNPKAALGELFLQRDALTAEAWQKLAKDVGSKLTMADDLTDKMLVHIDTVIDNTKTLGGRKSTLKADWTFDGACQEMCKILEVDANVANMAVMKKFIKGVYKVAETRGKEWAALSFKSAVEASSDHAGELIASRAYQASELANFHAGMWKRTLNHIEPFYIDVWRNWMDPHIIRPFARLYLITGSYAPWNWAEDVMRTVLDRGGFIGGKNTPDRLYRLAGHHLMMDPGCMEGRLMANVKYKDIFKGLAGRGPERVGELGIAEVAQPLIDDLVKHFGKEPVEQALLLRWIPKIGRDIQQAMYFPIRASAWAGGMQRSTFVLNRYITKLGEAAPDVMAALNKAVPKPRIPGIRESHIDMLHQHVKDASLQPDAPAAVRRVLDEWTERNIKTNDIGESLARYMELMEVREHFLDRVIGGALNWNDIDGEIRLAGDIMLNNAMTSPAGKAFRMHEIAESMLKETTVDFSYVKYGKGFIDLGPEGSVAAKGLVKELADKLPPNIKSKVTGFDIDKAACDARGYRAYYSPSTGGVVVRDLSVLSEPDVLSHEISHSWYQHMQPGAKEDWLHLVANNLIPEDDGLRTIFETNVARYANKSWDFDSVCNEYFANMMVNYITDTNTYRWGTSAIHRKYSVAAYNKMKPYLEKHFPKEGLPIEDRNRLVQFGNTIKEMGMESEETVSSLYTLTHKKLEGVTNEATRHKIWTEAVDNEVGPFLDTTSLEIGRLRTKINLYATDILTPEQLAAFSDVLDQYATRIGSLIATRKKVDAMAKRLIEVEHVKVGTPRFEKARDEIWQEFFTQTDPPRFADMVVGSTSFDVTIGVKQPIHGPIHAEVKGLTRADVALLLGGTPDQLSFAALQSAALMRKEYFRSLVARKSNDMARASGYAGRDALGFTDNAIDGVYDDVLREVRTAPAEIREGLAMKNRQLEEFKKDLLTIKMDASFDDTVKAGVKGYLDGVATELEGMSIFKKAVPPKRVVPKKGEAPPPEVPEVPYGAAEGSPEWWHSTQQSTMDDVMKEYYKTFTDYTNANALDGFMKQIYPYWTYESQRWFWLPRQFLQHPGIATAWGKWMNNSDFGYFHVPGTALEINLLRGTVWKGGVTSQVRRDYPEYYDQMFPEFFALQDYGQRWGFFPNVFWGLLTTQFGGREQQTGQLLPSIVRTPLDLFVAANPDSAPAKALYEVLFPDYFRDYQVMNIVSKRATTDQIERGINGPYIWEKRQRHDPLTDEEHRLWYDSVREVALYGPIMQHSGTMRMRPEEKAEAFKNWGEFIEEKTGLSPAFQKRNREHGYTIGDVVSGLSQINMAQIQEAEEYQRWLSPRMTASLRPSNEIEVNLINSEFWGENRRYSEEHIKPGIERLEDQAFRGIGGQISKKDYVAGMNQFLKKGVEQMHIIHGDTFNHATGQWETNPNSKSKFRNVPITVEERAAYYAEKGVMITMSPLDEMLNQWYQVTVSERIDRETNTPYLDFGTYFATQRAMDKLLQGHPELKDQWDKYLQRNWTPGRALYKDAMENYIQPYRNVQDIVIKEFSLEEQSLIDEYYKIRNIDQARAEEIQAYVMPNGLKLISQYQSMVSNAKKKLRMVSPMTDAQLLFWNITTTLLTPEAQTLYDQLVEQSKRLPTERI